MPKTSSIEIPAIAIIGMSGRFPEARNLSEFWRNLCDGRESVTRFSDRELSSAGALGGEQDDSRLIRAKGLLEDAEAFDAHFFGYRPQEAITIDPQYRLPGYLQQATYHPLFLYESIWSIINMIFLLWMARRFMDWLKPGSIFLMYLIFYGAGRVGLEFLRLDVSPFMGININQTFSGVIALGATILLYFYQRNNPPS